MKNSGNNQEWRLFDSVVVFFVLGLFAGELFVPKFGSVSGMENVALGGIVGMLLAVVLHIALHIYRRRVG